MGGTVATALFDGIDMQTRQFVGSGCYVVPSEPSNGNFETFETVSAEFGGQLNL